MIKPLIGIFNCATQEEITREMTDEEYAEFLASQPTFPEVSNGN